MEEDIAMSNKRKKDLFRGALWGLAALGAAQIYPVRELFFAWLVFILMFCFVGVALFLFLMLVEGTQAGLDRILRRAPVARAGGDISVRATVTLPD